MDPSPPTPNLYQQAIDAALDLRWEDAVKINRKIIKSEPQNVDALNRQAKAYMELGKPNLAKKYYSLVLTIDSYNPIALKNLKIMKSFKSHIRRSSDGEATPCHYAKFSPSLFLQEPGKTKIVSLLKVAEPQKLSLLFCGMKVEMEVKNRKITVTHPDGNYLGVLPDDINHLLLRLLRGGNKYDIFIKSVRVNSLSVIIKETFRSRKFRNQSSFLEHSTYQATTNILTPVDGASEADETTPEEEGEEG